MEQNIKDLEKAKENVRWLLENHTSSVDSVDFHGLAYWASEVERLRELIKNNL